MNLTAESTGLRAPDLAALLGREFLDPEDGAEFLGIEKNSLDYAMYRGRIPYVQYGARRLLTRQDLIDYRNHRDKGRRSELRNERAYVVKE